MSSSEAGERDKGLALWTVAVAEGARKVRVLFGIVCGSCACERGSEIGCVGRAYASYVGCLGV